MNLTLLSDANTIYIYQTFGIGEPDKMHAATDVPLVKLKKKLLYGNREKYCQMTKEGRSNVHLYLAKDKRGEQFISVESLTNFEFCCYLPN